MQASVAPSLPPLPARKSAASRTIPGYFLQPARIAPLVQQEYLRPDLMAGVTVGVVSLPQGIAFASAGRAAGCMGVYTSIVAAIVGALWGSSNQLSTGPTNSSSLLVFSILLPIAVAGSPTYLAAAGLLAVMSGRLRLVMGVARLGVLVNFVSDSVIVGFTAGAGVLIMVGQMRSAAGAETFPARLVCSTTARQHCRAAGDPPAEHTAGRRHHRGNPDHQAFLRRQACPRR